MLFWEKTIAFLGTGMDMIDSRQLAVLLEVGAVKTVTVQGTAGGFTVSIDGRLIEAKRGHPRIFRKLHTVASYLKGKGINEFTVSISQWSPG
jgi:hypothetical protein